MRSAKEITITNAPEFEKIPSEISSLDEITGGGVPKGRPVPVSDGPGVFVAFEEMVDVLFVIATPAGETPSWPPLPRSGMMTESSTNLRSGVYGTTTAMKTSDLARANA